MFDLAAILDPLPEHAVFVADAVPITGQRQRGHRIEKARRQPSQAAVAEPGIFLKFKDLVELDPQRRQRVTAWS